MKKLLMIQGLILILFLINETLTSSKIEKENKTCVVKITTDLTKFEEVTKLQHAFIYQSSKIYKEYNNKHNPTRYIPEHKLVNTNSNLNQRTKKTTTILQNESYIDIKQRQGENQYNAHIPLRSEISIKNRKRFMTYVQELNTLSFLELSTALNALYEQYKKSLPLWRIILDKKIKNGNDPQKYLEKFNEDELTCLISEMNPDVKHTGYRSLSEEERVHYLHHWADWLWVFYMEENHESRWFFEQMRSLEWSSQLFDNYDASKGNAQFAMYLAHSFIRSINIYRKCAHTIPLSLHLPDHFFGRYIFRGIRVKEFDITRSMFPTNFQSYSMNTDGVHSLLKFYARTEHKYSEQDTVVITLAEYDFTMQQLAQPIACFDFLSDEHPITTAEKELIFPPFCNFSLKEFELLDIKNEFHREMFGARLWKLARANDEDEQYDKDIKLLWVTKVSCLPLYDSLQRPFAQLEHSQLESGQYDSYMPSRAGVYKNIKFWHVHFPQENHPCIRLFATQQNDIMNTAPLTEQDIDIMIFDFMEYHLKSYELYIKITEEKNGERFLHQNYINDLQITRSKIEGNNYEKNSNSGMYLFYTKIKTYIHTQAKELKLSRYQVKLHLFSYFFEETQSKQEVFHKDDWKESQQYCLEWQNKLLDTKQSTLQVNDCYSVPKCTSHQDRYVCEYEDHTYSFNTDFPCTRKNKAKEDYEYGRFCKLS